MLGEVDLIIKKSCSKCGVEKIITDFPWRNKSGGRKIRNAQCASCVREYRRSYTTSDKGRESARKSYKKHGVYWSKNRIYHVSKAVAKKRKMVFTLSVDEYFNVRSLPCHYCQNVLRDDANKGIGLDRIDNSRGYEIDNVLPCCGFCNTIRSDKFSVPEMLEIASFIIKMRKLG
jgi:hypothetical protein